MPQLGEYPLPQPSPTGEGADCSRFCGFRRFEKQLEFATVDFRPSEKEKSSQYNLFSRRTLNPNSRPVLSPRGRELERGQQATRLVLGQLGNLGKVAAIWRMPSPVGEGAGCSGFKRYRSSEKRMPKTSTAGIFQVAFIARQMEQTPRAFFSDDL